MQIEVSKSFDLKEHIKIGSDRVQNFLDQYFVENTEIEEELLKSVRYSLLQSGAKRFRANLVQMGCEALGHSPSEALPFAAALECIHTYSLIHDDLPCMDNDDERRGQPTNHKVFGEATALLAGDALLTEAFRIVAKSYQRRPELAVQLTLALSQAAGMMGMISGQRRDIKTQNQKLMDLVPLQKLHEQKTGALIRVATEASAYICSADSDQFKQLSEFGRLLGLAFQVKDDILDHDQDETASYTQVLGLAETHAFLDKITHECLNILSLEKWDHKADALRAIAHYNWSRTH